MSEKLKNKIRKYIQNLNVAKVKEGRAPYKPFLLLIALANIHKDRLVAFSDIENHLRQMCEEFGPARKSYYPELPFWHLQNDGLWEIKAKSEIKISTRIHKSALIKSQAYGGFPQDIYNLLKIDHRFFTEIVTYLLNSYFPTSIHQDILSFVRLNLQLTDVAVTTKAEKARRDSKFRENIINAYEHRCAVCGFDGKLGISDFALEAAHIKWVAYGGSDEIHNGLALCVLHHKAFDRGAFAINDDLKLLVANSLKGGDLVNRLFLAYKGREIFTPSQVSFSPNTKYLRWHRNYVFKRDII